MLTLGCGAGKGFRVRVRGLGSGCVGLCDLRSAAGECFLSDVLFLAVVLMVPSKGGKCVRQRRS